MKVKNAMIKDVSAIFENETVEEFIVSCIRKNRSGFPVVDEHFRVVGFISESDIINNALPSYFSLLQSASFIPDTHQFVRKISEIKDEPVSKFMVTPPIVVHPEDTAIHAADLLIKKRLKAIPVVDDEHQLVGIFTRINLIHVALEGKINSR